MILHLKKPLANLKEYDPKELGSFFEELVCGFPVPVYLNGKPLSRPYALAVWGGLRFDLPGGAALVELDPEIRFSERGMTILQGLRLGKWSHYHREWPSLYLSGMRVYLHLQGPSWKIRVPDRDALYESEENRKRVEILHQDVKQAAARHIVEQGETERFFECLLQWGCFEAVRGLPIPSSRWSKLGLPLHRPHYEAEEIDDALIPLQPEEIPGPQNERRFLRGLSNLYADEETLDHLFAAYIFGIPILDSWKDPEHWFSRASAGDELEDFYRRDVSVSVNEIVAEGSWWGARVVLCRQFSLTLEGYGTQEVKKDVFIKGTFFIMDAPLHFNYPIDQAFSFQTEGEDFDEAGFDAAMEEFRAQVATMKKDLCGLIRSGLRPFTDALQGKAFALQGRDGEIHVEAVRA